MKVLNKIIYFFCVLCYTLSISGQIKSGVILFERKTNLLKKYKTPFVIQHSIGTPETMQKNPKYKNEL